jgi:uncharacterized protein YndB with AHSA1/START domain
MSDFVISRSFDASAQRIFDAWTVPEQLGQWWGPVGFAISVAKIEAKPGGEFVYCMKSPQGLEMWGKFAYREIAAPERIVFVNSFSNASGGIARHPFSPSWPLEVLNTLTLEAQGAKTLLTLRGGPLNATELERQTFDASHAALQQGFTGTLDQLAAFLAKV